MRKAAVAGRVGLALACGVVRAGTIVNRLNEADTGIRLNNATVFGSGAAWLSMNDTVTGFYWALSRFSLTGIKPYVVSAKLNAVLQDTEGAGNDHVITVFPGLPVDDDWVESEASFYQKANDVPWSLGGNMNYDGSVSNTTTWTPSSAAARDEFDLDVTAVLQKMIDNGQTNGTFYLFSDAPSWPTLVTVATKEVQWDRDDGPPCFTWDYQLLSVESENAPPRLGAVFLVK